MRDLPDNIDLLAVVAAFLQREVRPRLDGELAFQARVAANVLDQVRRALERDADEPEVERQRLAVLLGKQGDLAALTRCLCERIAAGTITLETPGLADFLWTVTLDKVAVDQPHYSTYMRAVERCRPEQRGAHGL